MLIGYARVSTEEQNLELQIEALLKAGCRRIFTDRGVSGAQFERPGLSEACAVLQPGDTLVVWRLDRLGRSLVDLINTVERFEARSVHFRSLQETIDTNSSGGRLVFHIMGAMAEFERRLISERTIAGMTSARRRGRHIGRPRALDEEQQAEVRRRLAEGKALKELAEIYGVSTATIRRVASIELCKGSS